MPEFIPKYQAHFIEPLVQNLKRYLETKEADALRWANYGELMEPTKVWRTSRWFNTLFPVTSVIPLSTLPAEADDASRLNETHVILLETEIDGSNPDKISSAICRRIKAYDQLLRKIGKLELLAGLNLAAAGGDWMDIGKHSYQYFAQSPTLYKLSASFELTIHVIEVAHE